jgi:hypothetical protein
MAILTAHQMEVNPVFEPFSEVNPLAKSSPKTAAHNPNEHYELFRATGVSDTHTSAPTEGGYELFRATGVSDTHINTPTEGGYDLFRATGVSGDTHTASIPPTEGGYELFRATEVSDTHTIPPTESGSSFSHVRDNTPAGVPTKSTGDAITREQRAVNPPCGDSESTSHSTILDSYM